MRLYNELLEEEMDVQQIKDYIEYSKTGIETVTDDFKNFMVNNLQLLEVTLSEHQKVLTILAYMAIFNGGRIKFPKDYFDLQSGNKLNIKFSSDDEWFYIDYESAEE